MAIVIVQEYGDFDILQTHSVWVGESDFIPTSSYDMDKDTTKVCADLRKQGFKQAKPKRVTIGSGY